MLRDRLYSILNNMYQTDTTYLIAEYIIHHMENLESISIYEVAKECHTSVATISRFCRKIGFSDFVEFRDACQEEMDSIFLMCSSHPEEHAILKNGLEDLSSDIGKISRQMRESLKKLSLEKVKVLVEDIKNFENVYFVGGSFSSVMYGHLQIELLNLRKYCHVIKGLPTEEYEVDRENSVAILFSMHGHMVKHRPELLEWAREKCTKTWEISQVHKKGKMDNTIYFGKCELVTADYMAWIYVADYIIYQYKMLLKK